MNGAKRLAPICCPIVEYIAQDNLDAALALVTEIEEKAERLREQPKLYRPGRVRRHARDGGTAKLRGRVFGINDCRDDSARLARRTDVAAGTSLMECCSSA